jgi:hypothetical protein
MFLATALEAAQKVTIEGNELCVVFTPDTKHLRDALAKPDSVKLLREVGRELIGDEIGVRISVRDVGEVGEENGPTSKGEEQRREKQRLREFAEQHPAVQQVLQAFHGEIVDVRKVAGKAAAESNESE